MDEKKLVASEASSRFRVTGRVQGVGFRWYTEKLANEIGVRGWVRNCSDGSVEAVASGTEAQLEEFERVLRRGPSGSRVRNLERTEEAERSVDNRFSIIY